MAEPVIGIDLGTTNSVVATVEEGKAKVIPNRMGGRLTPSVVGLQPSGERVVGERARLLAEEFPQNVAFATKRFIGRRYTPELAEEAKRVVSYKLSEGPHGEIRVDLGGKPMPLTQVSAMVLVELRLDAQAYFGRPVHKAVITVPANFDDAQRQATKEAARIAGLEVLRIVNEPTAAAVAYGLTEQFTGRALVFDLGGGTFDVSILEVQQGVFEVKATGGDPFLGGEDFDNRIVQWLTAQLPEGVREVAGKDDISLQRLKVAAEKAKKELTEQNESYISLTGLGDHGGGKKLSTLDTALTRAFFETLSEPLSRRCLAVCEKVMADAKLDPKSVDAVLLVGGMTRVPLVRRLVADYFGKEPVTKIDPDEVVALGAAIHAEEIAKKTGSALLIDVASHSLGVGVLGGSVRKLVHKNTPVPVSAKEIFLPGHSGQKEARIPVFQGESDFADENTRLGEVVLRDLSVINRADVPLEVTFELSSEGTLAVRATDLTSGISEAVRIEARTELSKGEVENLRRGEADYAAVQSKEDAESYAETFKRLIEKGEKLAAVLGKSAQENPSPDADAAVASVRSLLDLGRAALKAGNSEQIAEIGKRLTKLVGGR